MKRILTGILTSAALIALTAAPAAAQTTEVGMGFSLQKWNSGWGDAARGFSGEVSRTFSESGTTAIAVVGDLSWSRFSGEETDLGVMGGIRFKFMTNKKVSAFVQGTAGLMR